MSGFYSQSAATASRLIKQFGKQVILARYGEKVCDPITGACVSGEREELLFNGIISAVKLSQIDGVNIMQGDRMLLLDNSQVPEDTDKVLVSLEEWQIINLEEVSPAGVAIVYRVQIRR
ncbi:hypothetical protein [Endozoicomonas sp. ONNA1]|uniref:hypothetical protein n=1 Tax=Endozoicomonas sp. ONNA1 TaxID=2828740 RepID=UPI002148CAC7|nr:hypothetical protein [Endozoicomonas sp. ONNA1]